MGAEKKGLQALVWIQENANCSNKISEISRRWTETKAGWREEEGSWRSANGVEGGGWKL